MPRAQFRRWGMHILLWAVAALLTVAAFKLHWRFSTVAANDESVVRGTQISEASQALFKLMMLVALALTLWGFVVHDSEGLAPVAPEADASPPSQVPNEGPLTEAELAEPWAPLYSAFGGSKSGYVATYAMTSCDELQDAFDREMDAGDAFRGRQPAKYSMVSGRAQAASWRGDDLGCPGFAGMNDGRVTPVPGVDD